MMTTIRRAIVMGCSAALLCVALPADAQDASLVHAKRFYESADYEEALKVLESAPGARGNVEATAYRVFCLFALGRVTEARAGVEAIVKDDPLFRVSDEEASPRLRTFFDEVRKPLLPEAARSIYTTAKAAFDRKDWTTAVAGFDRAITLLGEIGDTAPGAPDLKFLASNFRDLAKTSIEPPKPPPPPAPEKAEPKAVTPPKPVEPEIYGVQHSSVKRPVSVSKTLPDWRPIGVEERMSFEGILEVVVNEQGKVDSVRVVRPVHPRYDPELVKAAASWTFKPATKDGVPVKYRYAMSVSLGR